MDNVTLLKDSLDDPWARFRRLFAIVQKRSIRLNGLKVLDVGCNQGQLTEALVRDHGAVAYGIDQWPETLPQGERRSWTYLQGDLSKGITFDEIFDVIFALETLEHMIDTDAFLKSCHAHLRQGGHFFITTPNINSLRNRALVPFGAYPAGMEYKNIIHHVRLYNVPVLQKHLQEHGFSVICTSGVHFLPNNLIRKSRALERLSGFLAGLFPQLCGNLIVVCVKK